MQTLLQISKPASQSSGCLPTLISNESYNHAVEVEEEHEQVEAEFDKGFFLVDVQFSEDLSSVEKVLVIIDPIRHILGYSYHISKAFHTSEERVCDCGCTYFFPFQATSGRFSNSGSQYPLIRNSAVKKAWMPASGMMYMLRRLQRSIGLM